LLLVAAAFYSHVLGGFTQAMQKKLSALVAAGGPHLADLEVEYDAATQLYSMPDQQQQQSCSSTGARHLGLALTSAALAARSGVSGKQAASSTIAGTAGSFCSGDTAADGTVSRETLLAEALADAEGAVALLQARLLTAVTQQQLTDQRLQDLQQRSAAAAVRHAQALAAAKQSGAAQLAALKEAVSRLGSRGELAGQVRLCYRVHDIPL
jgi:hypothetical protein